MDIGVAVTAYCAIASLLLAYIAYRGLANPWKSTADSFLEDVMLCILWPVSLAFIAIIFCLVVAMDIRPQAS